MRSIFMILGVLLLAVAGLDAFQTIVLPRRPAGRWRLTRLFFIATWTPWSWAARHTENRRLREQFLSVYGPLSLLMLLTLWGSMLVVGFAMLMYALGSPFQDVLNHALRADQFRTDLYVSGTTLTTLGPGDVVPRTHMVRALMILESATGLGFVALVVGYLPVLYGAFSRREVSIALLDARAGSPPTASELLNRHGFDGGEEALIVLLAEWERWAAELLESHISYPVLCYYRSQHDNQSWLGSLMAILDACALVIAGVKGMPARQAQLTFAIARHAVIDLGHVFHQEARTEEFAKELAAGENHRLPQGVYLELCHSLSSTEIELCDGVDTMKSLTKLRSMYEPQAMALSEFLVLPLPAWITPPRPNDAWRTVSSLRHSTKALPLASVPALTEHISPQAASAHLHDDEQHGI